MPGEAPGPGYCLKIQEDGTEVWVPSWPTSPCSEPVEESDT